MDDWLGDDEPVEHTAIDGIDAIRVVTKFEERDRRLAILVPRERLGMQFNWYAGDDTEPQHLREFEEILRTARFFARQSPVAPTISGKPLGDLRSEWERACKKAGQPVGRKQGGLVFHDTRWSAITNLAAAGVPDIVARSISGHRTASVHSSRRRRQSVGTRCC